MEPPPLGGVSVAQKVCTGVLGWTVCVCVWVGVVCVWGVCLLVCVLFVWESKNKPSPPPPPEIARCGILEPST